MILSAAEVCLGKSAVGASADHLPEHKVMGPIKCWDACPVGLQCEGPAPANGTPTKSFGSGSSIAFRAFCALASWPPETASTAPLGIHCVCSNYSCSCYLYKL